ncbi:hypothetical protein [Pseudorhodoferax soli]|uniref:Uncharacterized protein n=1 Tax=Pseudorhodoferax soli TaxID=545864 RepID=A0A368XE38_9BURK|nr:hypothetical protein [Pseudorhodoferax soli]RCW66233.1 hypothetical protein DES41_111191 [Pseudorhodoferax soli]
MIEQTSTVGQRRPTGLTNDASVLAPNCKQCLAIIPHGKASCDNCSSTAPDTVAAPTRADMIVLLRKVHRLITEGQRSMLDDDVTPLVQDLTDEAIGLAKELELAAAMEAALVMLSECGWLVRDVREIPSVAKAKAIARDVVDDILLMRLTR